MSRRVLIVEDDNDVRESLIDILSYYGYEATGAAHGREALDLLETPDARPCIILLDLMMPIMDGRAFREDQLRDPEIAEIPVVVISAYRDVMDSAKDMHAAGYLPKPLELTALLRLLRENCPNSIAKVH